MKKIVGLGLSGFFMLIAPALFAQTYAEEALLFSRINPGGSARIQAMGGAQVALGGDYSSSFSNPAGLGFFNKSEATLSMATNFYNSTSTYLSTDTKDSKSNFNIPGFSLVLHSDKNTGKLISGNFAISFSRTNNFNQNFTYQGTNSSTSLIDYFMDQSTGYDPSQFSQNGDAYYSLSRLGFSNYLFGPSSEINPGGDSTLYHSYADKTGLKQRERVQTTGAQNQFNVSYGANFNDLFYLGATVGFPSFNYRSQKAYSEYFHQGPLIGFNLNEDYTIKGSGVNLTIGGIIKPKDFVQLGVSVATPTYFYSIADNYTATLSSQWDNFSYVDITYPSNNRTLTSRSDGIDQLIANYTLTTPWRIKAGATIFIKKHGLITAEVEKVNYGKSSLSSQTDGLDFTYDNKDIKNFASVMNLRGGGEYRFGNFRVRAGYSYMPDPYLAVQNNTDNSITGVSGGLGYRTTKYTIDLGYIHTQWNSSYRPYTIYSSDSPVVVTKNSSASIMVTFGITL